MNAPATPGQRANYSAKVAILTPVFAMITGIIVAQQAHAQFSTYLGGAVCGFIVGGFLGAISAGISGLILFFGASKNTLVVMLTLVCYVLLPLVLLCAACGATVLVLRRFLNM